MFRTLGAILISILYPLCIVAAFARPDLGLLWRRAIHHPYSPVPPFRATLAHCGFGDEIQGAYVVWLRQYVSLEQHMHNVAVDPEKITHCFPESFLGGIYYYVEEINDAELEAIRADLLVDTVDCNRPLNLRGYFDSIEVELIDTPPEGVVRDSIRPGRRLDTVDSEL